MKQKKQNRILAALLAVAMMFQMLPMLAFAAEGQAKIGDEVVCNTVDELKAAVEAAPADGTTTTIKLGKGDYTLYGTKMTEGKNLTFVGQGDGLTTWKIGYPNSDQGGEHNSDYSFQGSKTITFKDMTLEAGPSYNYQGFSHTDTTVVDNCVVKGMTAYWGYNSATFKDTTFKPGYLQYALWAYCSEDTTFDHCKFECKGKAIYAYNEGNPLIKIHFKDCEVTGSLAKSALSVDDSKGASFEIYISGDNKVNANRDTKTCSQVYGFDHGCPARSTKVYYGEENENPELLWQNGQRVTHNHSDGERDQAFTPGKDTGWTPQGDHYEREITEKCDYCGYEKTSTKKSYKLEYELNGGKLADGADDKAYDAKYVPVNEEVTLAAAPTPPEEGSHFLGWDDGNGNLYKDSDTIKMTANTKLTARWGEQPPEPPEVPDTPDGGGKEVATVIVAAGAAVLGYYVGTGLLMDCYRLPYWPKNRSELALMLWEDADRPMPESTLLYPDVGQKEEDMDLQHAARWAMENELLPDLNWDDSRTEEEMKFYPNYAVSRVRALHAWRKAQQLKQDA